MCLVWRPKTPLVQLGIGALSVAASHLLLSTQALAAEVLDQSGSQGVSEATTYGSDNIPALGPDNQASKSTWNITLGLGVAAMPKYPGAKTLRLDPAPAVSITYQDTYFFGQGGIGANVINWNGLKAGPILGFDVYGRSHSDGARVRDLDKIQPSINGGGFVSYEKGPFEIGGSVRQAITHSSSYGLLGVVGASYHQPIIPGKLDLRFGPIVEFGDADYMRTWFGVTRIEATRSGLRAFQPGGGIEDAGLNASLTYRYSRHVVVQPFVQVKELLDNAKNSPITQRATQVLGGFSVGYHF